MSVAGGSPAWRRGVAAVLEDAGYETEPFAAISDWKPGVGGSAVIAQVDNEAAENALRQHSAAFPHIPLLAVVEDASAATTAHLLRLGATAVLDENEEVETFPDAVRASLQGRSSLPTIVVRAMAQSVPDRRDVTRWLDDNEAAWLRRMSQGQTVSEIADDLGYSERAMFRILRNLYTRLGVKNRTEALIWASRNGLLDDPNQ